MTKKSQAYISSLNSKD